MNQARQLLAGRGGKMVQVSTGADGSLQELVGRFPSDAGDTARSHFSRLTVLRGPDGRWMSSLRAVPYGSTTRLASGTIRNSLFGAIEQRIQQHPGA